ncbi:hypothetical protein CRM22_002756 [Opisthorchis felineus]|uniref:Uncharacterized protein n=1 Tax=Opisthorchis felineus TaxID=147828 RepID=A0A4V3SG81_OPIFE|nr:hypothetical protein CRM22_002756 [Opisthorchis felineus]
MGTVFSTCQKHRGTRDGSTDHSTYEPVRLETVIMSNLQRPEKCATNGSSCAQHLLAQNVTSVENTNDPDAQDVESHIDTNRSSPPNKGNPGVQNSIHSFPSFGPIYNPTQSCVPLFDEMNKHPMETKHNGYLCDLAQKGLLGSYVADVKHASYIN